MHFSAYTARLISDKIGTYIDKWKTVVYKFVLSRILVVAGFLNISSNHD